LSARGNGLLSPGRVAAAAAAVAAAVEWLDRIPHSALASVDRTLRRVLVVPPHSGVGVNYTPNLMSL